MHVNLPTERAGRMWVHAHADGHADTHVASAAAQQVDKVTAYKKIYVQVILKIYGNEYIHIY